ncbi:15358_t:CDS:1, partial [Gigaspora rosea]
GLGNGYKIWSKNTNKYKQEICKHKKERPKKEKILYLTDQKEPNNACHTNPNVDVKAKTRAPESRVSMFKSKSKKEENKIWSEMLNNGQNTNKTSRKKNL